MLGYYSPAPRIHKGRANSGCEICGVLSYIQTRWSAVVNIKNSICSIIGWINHDALNSLCVALFIRYVSCCMFPQQTLQKAKTMSHQGQGYKGPTEKNMYLYLMKSGAQMRNLGLESWSFHSWMHPLLAFFSMQIWGEACTSHVKLPARNTSSIRAEK